MGIYVERPGMLTTVQDAGRFGYQKYGISPCGALDQRSFRWANLLVGNDARAAALEVTVMGPVLRFTTPAVAAITGADMAPTLNDKPVGSYRAFRAKEGDVLKLNLRKTGCRAYIAFSGGLDVPEIMGSHSTYLRCSFGGLDGRALKAGDEIAFLPKTPPEDPEKRVVPAESFASQNVTIRVIPGPEKASFTEKGYETFFGSEYTVTGQSDRQGLRLDGDVIEHVKDDNIISNGIAYGSIQVPGDGKPIVILADRQTTVGYTKIGTVISVDLPLLGQLVPGMSKIRFRKAELYEAQKLYREQEMAFRFLERIMG